MQNVVFRKTLMLARYSGALQPHQTLQGSQPFVCTPLLFHLYFNPYSYIFPMSSLSSCPNALEAFGQLDGSW